MKIGILQTGHSPPELIGENGNYGSLFVNLLDGQGFDFEIFDVLNMSFPSGPEVCDGWLITGSRHGAYEDLPFIAPLEDLIRAIIAADKPLVGICFGHQIIAQALGGTVEKFDGGWAVGRQTYAWMGEDVALNAWHQDQVTTLPEGAERQPGSPDHREPAPRQREPAPQRPPARPPATCSHAPPCTLADRRAPLRFPTPPVSRRLGP